MYIMLNTAPLRSAQPTSMTCYIHFCQADGWVRCNIFSRDSTRSALRAIRDSSRRRQHNNISRAALVTVRDAARESSDVNLRDERVRSWEITVLRLSCLFWQFIFIFSLPTTCRGAGRRVEVIYLA